MKKSITLNGSPIDVELFIKDLTPQKTFVSERISEEPVNTFEENEIDTEEFSHATDSKFDFTVDGKDFDDQFTHSHRIYLDDARLEDTITHNESGKVFKSTEITELVEFIMNENM